MEERMRKLIVLMSAAAAIAVAPTVAMAQIAVDTPVGGVRIGEPRHDYHTHYGYRAPVYEGGAVEERRVYRERQVRGGCRTVTIRHDDGSMKRIERCN
jgi:hypothetical protein